MFRYFLYQFGLFVLKNLPPKRSYQLVRFISDTQYSFSLRDRKAIYQNLKIIVGDADNLNELTREVFRNFGRYLVEFFSMKDSLDETFIHRHIKIDNIDRISRVLDEGKGGIILTAHLGNFELGAAVLSLKGFPVHAVALAHKEPQVNQLFNLQREAQGVQVITSTEAVRKCKDVLGQNALVGLVADRDFSKHGVALPFFGKQTLIPKGPAMFSLKTGAPVIPTFLIRTGGQKFQLKIGEPIYPPVIQDQNESSDVMIELMQKYIKVIEEQIRQYPSQWLMFHPFWIHEGVEGE